MPFSSGSGTIDVLDGEEAFGLGLPDEGVVAFEVGRVRLAQDQTLNRPGNPFDKPGNRLLKVHVARPLQRRLRWL
jgi:hypothetical protein